MQFTVGPHDFVRRHQFDARAVGKAAQQRRAQEPVLHDPSHRPGVVVFALLHLQGFIPIDSPKNPVHRLLGWQDLGAKVDQLRLDLGGPETTFVFSDAYGTTAELSFYVPGQIRAFCVAGGRKRNQYDLWPGPGPEFESAVFVVKGEDNQISDRVARLFEKVDPPQVVTTTHQGRAGQTFTLFACRGFQGGWPAQEGTAF